MQVTSFVQISTCSLQNDGADRERERDETGASHNGDWLSNKKNAQHESVDETLVAADGRWYAALLQE